ncbi:hypothetical protein ACWDBD_21720 [Streptomyces sp. NPDC001118]
MTTTPEQFDEQFRKVNGSYATTRERLRAAGERASLAEAMRRAAIAEMGQAIRDHRAVLDVVAPELRGHHRVQMDDAEDLTGISRRTLSDAVRNDTGRSDAEVAGEYRAYAYDLHYGGEELHRRYPQLAGLWEALKLLTDAQYERWRKDHPDELFEPLLDFTEEQLVLHEEYQRRVEAIRDRRPPR